MENERKEFVAAPENEILDELYMVIPNKEIEEDKPNKEQDELYMIMTD